MTEQSGKDLAKQVQREYTKEEIGTFLSEISMVSEKGADKGEGSYLHALIALNHLLNLPSAPDLFDDKLKSQARELWDKLKGNSLELIDPPFLYGLPAGAIDAEEGEAE